MKYIIGNRGCGATTQLIMESATFNIPILATISGSKNYEVIASNMGLEIPKPISLFDLKNGNLRGKTFDKILIDDAGYLLKYLLHEYGLNTKVITTAITLDEID